MALLHVCKWAVCFCALQEVLIAHAQILRPFYTGANLPISMHLKCGGNQST